MCLYSSVAERQSCKLKVLGSIPSGGLLSVQVAFGVALLTLPHFARSLSLSSTCLLRLGSPWPARSVQSPALSISFCFCLRVIERLTGKQQVQHLTVESGRSRMVLDPTLVIIDPARIRAWNFWCSFQIWIETNALPIEPQDHAYISYLDTLEPQS